MNEMNNNKTMSIHYFLRGIILFSFALFIVMLVRTDSMLYYIAPRMMIYVKISAMGFYAISVYQLFLGFKALKGKVELCDCENIASRSLLKNSVVYGLFIFPLLLGFLLPNAVMGSSLAAKKGVNLSSSNLVKTNDEETRNRKAQIQTQDISLQEPSSDIIEETSELSDAEIEKLFEYDIFTEFYAKFGMELYKNDIIMIEEEIFIETLTTIDLFLDTFVGKKIQISGFVHREDNMTDKQFVVSRFAIQCCSADAAPYGVLIEYDKANNFADDEWVKVVGTLTKTIFNDFEIMNLNVETIEKIEEPGAPYVYPNYDFGY